MKIKKETSLVIQWVDTMSSAETFCYNNTPEMSLCGSTEVKVVTVKEEFKSKMLLKRSFNVHNKLKLNVKHSTLPLKMRKNCHVIKS